MSAPSKVVKPDLLAAVEALAKEDVLIDVKALSAIGLTTCNKLLDFINDRSIPDPATPLGLGLGELSTVRRVLSGPGGSGKGGKAEANDEPQVGVKRVLCDAPLDAASSASSTPMAAAQPLIGYKFVDSKEAIPPEAFFAPKQKSSRSGREAVQISPEIVVAWEDFVTLTTAYDLRSHLSVSTSSSPQDAYRSTITSERGVETHLDHFVFIPLNRTTSSFKYVAERFTIHEISIGGKDCTGFVDLLCIRNNGTPTVFIETRHKSTLPNSIDLVHAYHDPSDADHQNATALINKLNAYMTALDANVDGYQFGIASNYTSTWFMRRSSENILQISPAIDYSNETPTLLRCFAVVAIMAMDHPQKRICRAPPPISSSAPLLSPRPLRRLFPIGEGRTGPVRALTLDAHLPVAAKCVYPRHDVFIPELNHEFAMYSRLTTIQGTSIPTVRFFGLARFGQETVLCLATDLGCCSLPYALRHSSHARASLLATSARKALSAVHDLGVAHRDIKLENFVVTADSRVWLVDFAFASTVPPESVQTLKQEDKQLEKLLRQLVEL